jgi:hypothetical protein
MEADERTARTRSEYRNLTSVLNDALLGLNGAEPRLAGVRAGGVAAQGDPGDV